MSAAEEKLSPEEKLLRVIQGGKQEEGDEAVETEAVAAEAGDGPALAVSIDAGDKTETAASGATDVGSAANEEGGSDSPPRLKLADQGGSDVPAADAAAAVMAAPADDTEQTVAVASVPDDVGKRKRFAPTYGINVANKVLAIAILFVLLLTGFEIWSQVKASQAETPPEPIQFEQRVPDIALPDLNKLLDNFNKRALFAVLKTVVVREGPKRPVDLTKDLSFMGISKTPAGDQEAIVMNEKGNMNFLMEGANFEANGSQMTVARIEGDSITFVDEWEREWILKP